MIEKENGKIEYERSHGSRMCAQRFVLNTNKNVKFHSIHVAHSNRAFGDDAKK